MKIPENCKSLVFRFLDAEDVCDAIRAVELHPECAGFVLKEQRCGFLSRFLAADAIGVAHTVFGGHHLDARLFRAGFLKAVLNVGDAMLHIEFLRFLVHHVAKIGQFRFGIRAVIWRQLDL